MNKERRGARKKWTNEFVAETINGRAMLCTTDLTHVNQPSVTSVGWKCCVCNHEWKARLDNVVGKNSGCPKCAGNLEYTLDTFRAKLNKLGRHDIEVHELISRTSATTQRTGRFTCVSCNHEWTAIIHNVLKFGYGCPVCNSNWSTPVIDSLGNHFHSKLEYYFWTEYHKNQIPLPLVRQQRYNKARRCTCDFVLPSINTWVEISGALLLQQPKYASTIEWKRQVTQERHHNFVVLSTFAEITQFINALKKDHHDSVCI